MHLKYYWTDSISIYKVLWVKAMCMTGRTDYEIARCRLVGELGTDVMGKQLDIRG